MSAPEPQIAAQQSAGFLYLYGLAAAGGAVGYIPFLTILLPIQATAMVDGSALALLAQVAFVGAISASVANILFGWASDRSGTRRPWIFAGMIVSSALLVAMPYAGSTNQLFALIICWQFGLNMMLAPLSAWGGDSIPDSQKGLLGGLLAFAPALGALSGVFVTQPGLAEPRERVVVVALLVIAMILPALVFGRPRPMPQLMVSSNDPAGDAAQSEQPHVDQPREMVIRMWLARLLVQIAEASLFAFLLLWFRSVDPQFTDNDSATIFASVLGAAVVVTLGVGRWSDRRDRPILPLSICAGIAAAGLMIMAFADGLTAAIVGYVVFGLSSSIFLALHSSQTLRVLARARTRGTSLGLFNLTNTMPSLIMPWLTLAMVPVYGFGALFAVLAVLAGTASALLIMMPGAARKSQTPR